jgi:hypothetical protein
VETQSIEEGEEVSGPPNLGSRQQAQNLDVNNQNLHQS